MQATQFEIGGQYEFIKPQGDGFAFAFRTLYEVVKDAPGEILFGPLAPYGRGHDSTTLNTFFFDQVRFGLAAFGEIENLPNPGSFNDQLHRAGPVISLNLGEGGEGYSEKRESGDSEREQQSEAFGLKMAAGVLLGLSDATSDLTFKLDAEIEF